MSIDDRSFRQAGPPPDMPAVGPAPAILRVDDARRRRLRPWAIAWVAVLGVVTGGVTLSYTSVFAARVVEVDGEDHLAPRQVLRAAGVSLGTNVAHLDESEVESRLEMEPWILDSRVETSLPGTIVISVTERSPVLVSELDGDRRMVAGDGTVLGRALWPNALPEVGTLDGAAPSTEMIQAASAVVRTMAPTLRAHVDTIVIESDASATLVIDHDVEVRYGPVDETSAKAQALRAILEFADREDMGLVSIDVSAPAAPTARFEGSQMPISVPDPSADVPTPDPPSDTTPAEDTPDDAGAP